MDWGEMLARDIALAFRIGAKCCVMIDLCETLV